MDAESGTLVGTLGTAFGIGLAYAVNVVSKKVTGNTAAAANDGAQKDMLEFMKAQLESEVERREKVEQMYEQLYGKFNELSKQLGVMEAQNERLEHRVAELSDLVASLKGNP